MRNLVRQFLLALLLVWFPLQSIAAPALILFCQHEMPSHERGASEPHASHNHALQHSAGHNDGAGHAHSDHGGGGDSGHNCCDLQLSALMSIALDPVSPSTPPQVPAQLPAVQTFISEQPLHPPSFS